MTNRPESPDSRSHDTSQTTAPRDAFGAAPSSRRSRMFRGGAMALVLIGALALTYASADRDAAADDAMAGHDHSGAAAGGTAATGGPPVELTRAQADRIGVTYATVALRAVAQDVRAVGIVTADEARVTDLSLKVDGWVETLYVNVTGQDVARGASVLALYSPMLVAAQEELLLARRLQEQVRGGDPSARTSADELLSSARARLRYWDVSAEEIAAIEEAGRVQRTITFHSRAAGSVIEKRVVEGQRVMAGEPLLRLADLSVVWVEAEVFAHDAGTVRVGQQVSVEFEGTSTAPRRARIAFVQPVVDPASRTTRVRVELPNTDRRLRPGMFATIRIAPTVGDVLSVPRSALLATGERTLVFVRQADGRLAAREVRTGRQSDRWTEILSGVRAGDVVVSSATFLLDAESSLRSLAGTGGDMPGMPGMKMDQP